MSELTLSPLTAIVWEMWRRSRTSSWILVGNIALAILLNHLVLPSFDVETTDNQTFGADDVVMLLNFHLLVTSILLFLAACGYTEFNPKIGFSGFPNRLFSLPVSTFRLVAVPTVLSIVAAGILCAAWVTFVPQMKPGGVRWRNLTSPAVLMCAYLVVFQMILWTLGRLASFRMVVLGLAGIVFLALGFLPTFPQETLPWWFSERAVTIELVGIAGAAFVISWIAVARQRSGGSGIPFSLKSLAEAIFDFLPRRDRPFKTAHAAQFWYEWRRSGKELPLWTAGMLFLVIGPLCWLVSGDSGNDFRILFAAVALPIVLAAPVGKAFSKPDFWSGDLDISPFLAVRPLSSEDLVRTKLRVAAVSALASWLMVFVFLFLWRLFWASPDGLGGIRLFLWQVYGHSLYPQYGLAALSTGAGLLLTWRFLVSGLWLGLAGNKILFTVSAIPYALLPIPGLLALLGVLGHEESVAAWIQANTDRLLPACVWIAVAAVIGKLWLAAFAWRESAPVRVRQYLFVWLTTTVLLVVFSLLLWSRLRYFLPSDAYLLRSLLVLSSILIIPLARIGLAPSFLARNRHR
jgi:hypothetical protein